MSMPPINPSPEGTRPEPLPPTYEPAAPPPARSRRVPMEELVLVLLVVLSGIGVALTDYSPPLAFRYWLWMAPVFGVVSAIAAWSRAQRRGEPVGRILPTQVLHWLAVIGAVYLIYLLHSTGRMTNEAAGSAVLIVLALAAFLAGIYADWRLSVLGLVLGVAAAAFAVLEQVVWIVVMPALVIGIVVLVVYMRR
ncbi:MAG: hypothetical protein AB7V27_08820 [Candidatus Binatia bacterium]